MKNRLFTISFISIFFSGLIYLLFRSANIRLFKLFDYFSIKEIIVQIRFYTIPLSQYIPKWIIYSLPDGLWLLSFSLLIGYLWRGDDKIKLWFWILLFPITAFTWEIGQAFKLINGTFDWIDIFIYLAVTLFIIYRNQTIYYAKTT